MDNQIKINKNSAEYSTYLETIKKDIERLIIFISSFNSHFKSDLIYKLNLLKSLINKIENNSRNYETNKIIISDEYVILNLFDIQEIIEVDNNNDIIIDIENIILIKRNMREFYFGKRKVLFEVEENFTTYKTKSIWYTDYFIFDNNILNKENNLNIEEVIKQKIYSKGSKM